MQRRASPHAGVSMPSKKTVTSLPRGLLSALFCGSALAAAQLPALGQMSPVAATLETVVVTAEKRPEPLQTVPIAVSVLSGKELASLGGSDLSEVAGAVPGLSMQSDRAGENRITMRGISEVAGGAPTVGVYMDEIPITTFTGEEVNLKTFDLERIEALRGPQGTLYGEGSEGGTVRIITNKPDAEKFSGAARATVSDTDGGGLNDDVDAMLNLPLVTGKLALRIDGLWSHEDGWINAPLINATHYNKSNSSTGRADLRFTPGDGWIVDLGYLHQDSTSDGPSVGDLSYVNWSGTAEPRNDRYDIYSLTVRRDLGFATFTSATGYFDRSSFSHNDFTSTAPLLGLLFGAPIETASIGRPNDQRIVTEEARLVSNPGTALQWTVGAFFKHDNLLIGNSAQTTPAVPDVFNLGVDDINRQYAVFGQGDYAFAGRWHLIAGVRYFDQERETYSDVSGLLPLVLSGTNFNNVTQRASASHVTSKVSLDFDITSKALLYATASSGFRAGDINPYAFLFPGAPKSFGPETLWNYELGVKTSWLNDRLIADGAVFYDDWKNIIIDAPVVNPLFGYSINAGKAHSQGVELELTAMPLAGLQLSASGTYTKAVTDNPFPGDLAPAGATLAFVPRYKLSGSSQYEFPLGLCSCDGRLRADVFYQSKSYSNVSNEPYTLNAAYPQLNLQAGVVGDLWDVTLFADNVTNEKGETGSEVGNLNIVEYTFIRPRTIGLTVDRKF